MTTNNFPLGCTLTEQGASFKVWAPNAKAAFITGSFNDWQENTHSMTLEDGGVWSIEVAGVKAGDEYQFRFETQDGNWLSRNDPRAKHLTNSAGNSVVYNPDFDWGDKPFEIADWNKLVIYELHVGAFTKNGDNPGTFDSAIEKLPYLRDLGINAIEIMPVGEFPGDYSWGYNPAYPFAVEESYGGPDAFKRFIKAAHDNDIAVLLDVVYNHFGPSDLHLWQFDGWSENGKGGIYFYNDWKSETPWGDTRPDYGRAEVRQYIYDNALMWLDEFKLDGLRMDMVPYLLSVDGSGSPDSSISEAYDLVRWINKDIIAKYPKALVIAEDLHSNDFITNTIEQGGCGYGAQWDAEFVHPVRAFLQEANDGNRDLESLDVAINRRYSRGSFHRVIYTESHDETANGKARVPEEISSGDVDNDQFAKQRAMLGIAITLTSPGIPMLLQGQELLEYEWFDDSKAIHWERAEKFGEFLNLVSQLIKLRLNAEGQTAGLTGEGYQNLWQHHQDKTLAYVRYQQDKNCDGIIVILNCSVNQYQQYGLTLASDLSDWRLLLAGTDRVLDDVQMVFQHEQSEHGGILHLTMDLAPYSFAILAPML